MREAGMESNGEWWGLQQTGVHAHEESGGQLLLIYKLICLLFVSTNCFHVETWAQSYQTS